MATSATRRFSVIVPSAEDGEEVQLNQIMVDPSGLTVLTVPGEEVQEHIPFDLIQGWWLENEEEMKVIVTDEASSSSSAPSSSSGAGGGGKGKAAAAANVTREVKLKSKRAQDIVDCMQEVVNNLLQERQGQSAPASPAPNGDSAGEGTAGAGGYAANGAAADASPPAGGADGEQGKAAGASGYVFLKSGFLVRAPRPRAGPRRPWIAARGLTVVRARDRSKSGGRSSPSAGRSGTSSSSASRTGSTRCSTSRTRRARRTRTRSWAPWTCRPSRTYAPVRDRTGDAARALVARVADAPPAWSRVLVVVVVRWCGTPTAPSSPSWRFR